jgi:hypothetical protein
VVKRSIVASLVAFGLTLGIWGLQRPTLATQETPLHAEVRAGGCDASGEIVAKLTDPSIRAGDLRGSVDGIPAATSFTVAPIGFDALLNEEHSIVVTSSGEQVACGAVGGDVMPSGMLDWFVLSERNSSNVSGVASVFPPVIDLASTYIFLALSADAPDTRDSPSARTTAATPVAGIVGEDVVEIVVNAELTRVAAVPTPRSSPGSS